AFGLFLLLTLSFLPCLPLGLFLFLLALAGFFERDLGVGLGLRFRDGRSCDGFRLWLRFGRRLRFRRRFGFGSRLRLTFGLGLRLRLGLGLLDLVFLSTRFFRLCCRRHAVHPQLSLHGLWCAGAGNEAYQHECEQQGVAAYRKGERPPLFTLFLRERGEILGGVALAK